MEVVRKTLGEMVEEVARQWPQREALVHTEVGVRYSYALLDWEANRAAGGLIRLGLNRGDKVAIWADNIPEWIIAQIAVFKMGGVMVPVDPGAGSDDLSHILRESECRALIMARNPAFDESADGFVYEREKIPSLEQVIVVADKPLPEMIPWTELTAMGEGSQDRLRDFRHRIHPEDPVAIMYTSGTTGKPKGVVLDHLGLINKTLNSIERQGIEPEDRLALFFPLFHMFGNTCIVLAALLRGAGLVMPCRSFDPALILEALHREKCTALYGSPSMLIALLDHPEFLKKQWESVSKGIIGGSPCPMELMRRLSLDLQVSKITVAYGITEASSWITMTRPEDPIELKASTMGTPLPCCEVGIVDPANGEPLPPGRPGEICTRGFLMKEYYGMPAATAAVMDKEGWFHTGDLGVVDERGYLRITGRMKDVILRDGVEITPVELEEILYGLPEVSEVQVFGFPHPEKGKEVAAWVKLKQGARLTIQELKAHMLERLGPAKAPRYFKFVSDFPMTRSGKVQKFKLSEMAEAEYFPKGSTSNGPA
jgi:fatty-acyl-CoA synthase